MLGQEVKPRLVANPSVMPAASESGSVKAMLLAEGGGVFVELAQLSGPSLTKARRIRAERNVGGGRDV